MVDAIGPGWPFTAGPLRCAEQAQLYFPLNLFNRMVPPHLFDLSAIDLNTVQHDAAAVERVNPHRGAMRMLDGVIHLSPDQEYALAFKDVRDDEFWVPGHIPGRPIFPGVLMIEA